MFISYYEEIYTASTVHDQDIDFKSYAIAFTDEEQNNMAREVSVEEILLVLNKMNPHKSPGPHGLTTHFFKRYWDIIGPTVTKIIKDFFETRICLPL